MKLNTLLGVTEHSTSVFRKLIKEYTHFFDKKQGEFKGIRKTYTPREGTRDEPGERQFIAVVTTVDEKLDYLVDNSVKHLENVMNIEATNASGAKVELKLGDISFGMLSTLELMRLKSILEKEGLEEMYSNMPVRSDAEVWTSSIDELYADREIYETRKIDGVKKSLLKQEYIMEDPNLKNMSDHSRYTPVKSSKDIVIDLGDYTLQYFSGETTHRKRAAILKRRSDMVEAITAAIKEANDKEVVKSELDPKKLFTYLHGE